MPNVDILAKKTYCKWYDSYTYTTNECNYFWRQVQSVINDGRLTLGDGGKMKLDMNRFPSAWSSSCTRKFLCARIKPRRSRVRT
jgi:hypothetical protein